MRKILITAFGISLLSLVGCSKSDIVIADFESGTFDGWQIEGEAFGKEPATGNSGVQMEVNGFDGRYLANSFHGGGDNLKGSIQSTPFTIERNYINFKLGGGKRSYIELLINGESVIKTNPIVNSEFLTLLTWDVTAYKGKEASIKVVDDQIGGWGHIMVDQIEMSDTEKTDILEGKTMSFDIDKKFLLVPIEDNAPYTYLHIDVDGQLESSQLEFRMAQTQIDYWVPIEVEKYKGQKLTLLFDHVKKSDVGHSQIKQSDKFEYAYNEKYRPAYHFSPQYGWMNDPNGMVYHNGEYHLYFQHNPYGSTWGNMHWGHAISKDLKKWEYQPEALAPDALGSIFSGSAVVDKNNTAGFGENALIALYTSAGKKQTQSIAYSLDNGRTFTKYENNPVLTDPNYIDFRDPKVFWHENSKQWIMSLATTQVITFYGSKNLKEWTKLSDFGEGIGNHDGVWECPDLIPMTYNGKTKWMLIVSINPGGPNGGSASQYFIGDFDGKKFKADALPYPLWLDYGRDNYAGVTWSDAPNKKAIFIGWMSNWDYSNQAPSLNFKNASTIPRELSLVHNGKHLVVASNPVKEIEDMRYETHKLESLTVSKSHTIDRLLESPTGAYEIEMEVETNGASLFSFKLQNRENESLDFIFDVANEKMMVDRSKSGLVDFNPKFAAKPSVAPLIKKNSYKIRLMMDNASSEIFVDNGVLVQTNTIFPSDPYNTLFFGCEGADIAVTNIKVHIIK